MTRVAWCPFATQDVLRSGAGTFVHATPKIIHHTTEGSSYAGARAAYIKTGALPHFTDSFEHGRYEVWQHLPTDQAATALKHPSGKPETNRANCIQIEHVGMAGRAQAFDPAYLLGMATLCRWIETTTGVPRSVPFAFGVGAPRLSWQQWETFAGHFGHCHVPGNDHWDPGALDIDEVLTAGVEVPPAVSETVHPIVPTEVDMPLPIATNPNNGRFWVLTGTDGGIMAFEGDGSPSNVFFGNLLDHPEYDAGAGHANGPAVAIEFWPQGQGGEGYVIYTDDRAQDQRVRPYHFDAGTRK